MSRERESGHFILGGVVLAGALAMGYLLVPSLNFPSVLLTRRLALSRKGPSAAGAKLGKAVLTKDRAPVRKRKRAAGTLSKASE